MFSLYNRRRKHIPGESSVFLFLVTGQRSQKYFRIYWFLYEYNFLFFLPIPNLLWFLHHLHQQRDVGHRNLLCVLASFHIDSSVTSGAMEWLITMMGSKWTLLVICYVGIFCCFLFLFLVNGQKHTKSIVFFLSFIPELSIVIYENTPESSLVPFPSWNITIAQVGKWNKNSCVFW